MSGERERGLYDLHREFALRAAGQGDWDRFLLHAGSAAHVAWEKHLSVRASLWTDAGLEGALRELASGVSAHAAPAPLGGRKGLVFVASTLYDMGGHSETLRIWSELLRERFPFQTLILTAGNGLEHHFPVLERRLGSGGMKILKLDGREGRLQRTAVLAELLAGSGAACAFFFAHPDDPIAPAAAAAVRHFRLRYSASLSRARCCCPMAAERSEGRSAAS